MNIKTFVCVMGLLFLVAGIAKLVQQYKRKKRCTAQVKGYISFVPFEAKSEKERKLFKFAKVIGDISQKSARGKKGFSISEAYSEIITYSIDGVEHVTHTGHRSNNTNNYSVGQDVVTIAYDPSDLKRFYILENKKDLTFGIIAVIAGLICVMAPLIPD